MIEFLQNHPNRQVILDSSLVNHHAWIKFATHYLYLMTVQRLCDEENIYAMPTMKVAKCSKKSTLHVYFAQAHLRPSSVQYSPHHPLSHPIIDHPTDPKGGHDPPHPREASTEPIPTHPAYSRPPRRTVAHRAIIKVQAPKMQWCAEDLYTRRS